MLFNMLEEKKRCQFISEETLVDHMIQTKGSDGKEDFFDDPIEQPLVPQCLCALSSIVRYFLALFFITNTIQLCLGVLQSHLRKEVSKTLWQQTLHDVMCCSQSQ